MSDTQDTAGANVSAFAKWLAPALIGLVGGFGGAALFGASGLGEESRNEQTREYLLSNPEILPEVFEALQAREFQARLDPMGDDLETPYPGAVLGNPEGSVTLVKFTDYACGFCRSSVADVEALIAENPDLKVVIREYPILSQESADAARMALAAAQQGKFEPFYKAMFGLGRPTPDTIEQAATLAGVDLEMAREAIAKGEIDNELRKNDTMVQQMGQEGTPLFIAGDQIMVGAVGRKVLAEAIDDAREGAAS